MNPAALMILSSSLALGTAITLHSLNSILAWIGLEINTLAIIPLMTKTYHPRAIEAATKYFLIQATASATIVFSGLMNAWLTGEWLIPNTESTSANLMSIAIAAKLGIAPLHFWFPEVLQGLTIKTGLLVSTWQKLAPIAILIQLSNSVFINLTLTLGLLSMITGGWGGINQTQTRKILAFSSVAHMGWMMAVLKLSPQLTLLNFFLYTTITVTLFLSLSMINTKNISELTTSWSKTPATTTLILLSLLSLSGLPPFTGFMPKWLIAQEMIKQDLMIFALLSLMATLLSLFFYLRLTYMLSLTLAPNSTYSTTTWLLNKKTPLAIPITLSILLLPMTPSMSPVL